MRVANGQDQERLFAFPFDLPIIYIGLFFFYLLLLVAILLARALGGSGIPLHHQNLGPLIALGARLELEPRQREGRGWGRRGLDYVHGAVQVARCDGRLGRVGRRHDF